MLSLLQSRGAKRREVALGFQNTDNVGMIPPLKSKHGTAVESVGQLTAPQKKHFAPFTKVQSRRRQHQPEQQNRQSPVSQRANKELCRLWGIPVFSATEEERLTRGAASRTNNG